MTMMILEQRKRANRDSGAEGTVTSSTSSQVCLQTNGGRSPCLQEQLSDGICLWFALTFFSHWVIQNYNMRTTLVLNIPEGIAATLCSHATPKKSYGEGSETPKNNDMQENGLRVKGVKTQRESWAR